MVVKAREVLKDNFLQHPTSGYIFGGTWVLRVSPAGTTERVDLGFPLRLCPIPHNIPGRTGTLSSLSSLCRSSWGCLGFIRSIDLLCTWIIGKMESPAVFCSVSNCCGEGCLGW